MTNIKEVAKKVGVSASTVSRALSGKIFVAEDTKKKILDAVRELNYRPNPMAQGLKEGKSRTIALILPDITNPLYPKLVKAIEMKAAALDYTLVLFDTDKDRESEVRHLRSLASHFVGGAIIITASDDYSHLYQLKEEGIPFVVVNRDFDADFRCITNDNENGAHAVTRHLIEQGHRSIACLQVDSGLQRYRQRFDGFTRAHKEAGLRVAKKMVFDHIETAEQAYAVTKKLLALPKPPTAIVSFIDFLVFGIYSAVNDCGLKIPDDLSVVGFDDIDVSRHMSPPLTTYTHPVGGIAEAALRSLTRAMTDGDGVESGNITVDGALVVRKSVAALIDA